VTVVSLRGDPVFSTGEPKPDVIESLETALERAKAGDIQGVQIAIMHADGLSSLLRAGGSSYSLVGMLTAAAAEMAIELGKAD
jgi:hypothetical protein